MNYFTESLYNIAVHLIVLPCSTLHRRSYILAFLLWPMKGYPVLPSWQQHRAASATVLTSHTPGQKTTSSLTVPTQILGFLLSCPDLGQRYTLNKITEIGDEPTESEAVSSLPTTQGR